MASRCYLPWRKNDQEARGTTVWLPAGQTDLCPVTALEAWLEAAEISAGPLFRRLWRLPPPRVRRGAKRKPIADRYRMGTNAIDTDSIALVVKKWTGLAGLDGAAFAGHSLRRGAISSGVAPGDAHRPSQAVLRPRLTQKSRRICRARRIAAASPAQGHTVGSTEPSEGSVPVGLNGTSFNRSDL